MPLGRPLLEAKPNLALDSSVEFLLEAPQRNAARNLAEEAVNDELLGLAARYPPAHQVEELHLIHLTRRRAVGAPHVVGLYLQAWQAYRERVVGAEDEVTVGLVGVGLLRAGLDPDKAGKDRERLVAQGPL